jgi:hypothetical protein
MNYVVLYYICGALIAVKGEVWMQNDEQHFGILTFWSVTLGVFYNSL